MKEVSIPEAIVHALWEAHACIGQWALCACNAMLRKALDLWSADYRDRHEMVFDKGANERDNLYWRLKKIAAENPLYNEAIHNIMDALRLDANEALHDPVACVGGRMFGSFEASTTAMMRDPQVKLHGQVARLITSTMPSIELVFSDSSRWKKEPPG